MEVSALEVESKVCPLMSHNAAGRIRKISFERG
jgi:hypothetical protein